MLTKHCTSMPHTWCSLTVFSVLTHVSNTRSRNEGRRFLRREQSGRDRSVLVFRCCAGGQWCGVDGRWWRDSTLARACIVYGVQSNVDVYRRASIKECLHNSVKTLHNTPDDCHNVLVSFLSSCFTLSHAIHGSLETSGTDEGYKHSRSHCCANQHKPRLHVPRLPTQSMLDPSGFFRNTLLLQGLTGRMEDCSSK